MTIVFRIKIAVCQSQSGMRQAPNAAQYASGFYMPFVNESLK
jgi:hypothetical protein